MKKQTLVLREPGRWRALLVLGVFAAGALLIIGRGFQLQILERDFLTREGNKRALRTIEVPAHRGAIRDRRGEPLALSAPVESIWSIPGELLQAPEYLAPLAKLLGEDRGELQRTLEARRDRHFLYLRRHLSPDEARRVLALGAPGVFAQREYRRYYPAAEVTAQLVGFCDVDGRGQEGMEAAHELHLAGKPGARRVVRDRSGRVVEESGDYEAAEPGADVMLSIDLRLQYLAYRELKAAVTRHEAKGGLVVVADSRSGEILAMASQPGFNPNRPEERRASAALRNRAVVDLFEPGSAVKPLLVAQALELGAYRADSRIDTAPGFFQVGRLTVRDVHPRGELDLSGVLSYSSNVGAAKIGLALGPEAVWEGFRRFGLGTPLDIGFPGEARGVLRPHDQWGLIATATASYGYGLSVNALQLVRAYAALANEGLLPAISLLRREGPAPAERAVPPEIARAVRRMMQQVTEGDGTGRRAAIPGYQVAGKTGTVRKVAPTGGYHSDRHQAVFIGMVPASRPRLVGLVMIDEPRAKQYYGGQVAAPVFAAVMQAAVRLLQVAPDAPHTPALRTAGQARPPEART